MKNIFIALIALVALVAPAHAGKIHILPDTKKSETVICLVRNDDGSCAKEIDANSAAKPSAVYEADGRPEKDQKINSNDVTDIAELSFSSKSKPKQATSKANACLAKTEAQIFFGASTDDYLLDFLLPGCFSEEEQLEVRLGFTIKNADNEVVGTIDDQGITQINKKLRPGKYQAEMRMVRKNLGPEEAATIAFTIKEPPFQAKINITGNDKANMKFVAVATNDDIANFIGNIFVYGNNDVKRLLISNVSLESGKRVTENLNLKNAKAVIFEIRGYDPTTGKVTDPISLTTPVVVTPRK